MKKRILVIRSEPLRGFIHSIPFFAAIREHHKDDEITILTSKEYFNFCKESGFFNKGWIDRKPQWFNFKDIFELSKRLRSYKFSMVYDLQNDRRSDWHFRLSGFKKPNWNSSIVDWCSHPYKKPKDRQMNFEELTSAQLRVAGVDNFPKVDFSLFVKEDVSKKFDLSDRYMVMCPAGDKENIAHKWDPEKYSELIEFFHESLGVETALLGHGNDDFWLNANIARNCIKASPKNLAGKLNISDFISICSKSQFCIGNDTSPTHVAALCGVKTIMICSRFSPPEEVAPKIPNLAIIEEAFLENLSYERVFDTFEEFILPTLEQGEKGYRIMMQTEEKDSAKPQD